MIARRQIARAATLIMLGNVASRVLGVVRDQSIAYLFGASGTTDAYRAAYRVPQMAYDLLIGNSISAALVPTFTDYAQDEDRAELWRVVNAVLLGTLLALGTMAAVMMLFSRDLVALVASSFSPQEAQLATRLLRVMLPSLALLGLSAVMTAALYTLRRFIFPAFAAACFNAGIILAVVLLARALGPLSLALGVLAGAAMQAGLQGFGLRRAGAAFRSAVSLRHPAIGRILRLYLPVAAGLVVSVLAQVLDLNLAARTGEGSIAVLGYATTLIQLPLGLVGTATSGAVLPSLSAYAASGEVKRFRETLSFGCRLALVAVLPATVGLIILREPLIALLFQRGQFGAADTARTSTAFLAYSFQLPFAAIDQLLIFAFYARKETVTPVLVGVAGVLVYLAVALPLLGPLGMPSLALANSAQNSAHAVILLALLQRKIGSLAGEGVGVTLGKSALATVAMALAAEGALQALRAAPLGAVGVPATLSLALILAVCGAVGAAVYALAVVMLRVEEAAALWRLARARLARSGA